MKSRLLTFTVAVLLLFTAASFLSAGAETVVPNMALLFESKQFTTEDGYLLNYSVHLPQDYDPAQKYPVVLFMHGAGERGSDLKKHLQVGIIESFKRSESPLYDCIVVAPQCPEGKQWVNVPTWQQCIYSVEDIPESRELAAVVELVKELKNLYATNTNRYYVTGLSMGGYATWDLLVRHPELFAAAMPLCGGAARDSAEVIREIPVWAFHGLKDPTVPYTGTKQMCARLKQLGNQNVIYTEYPDHAHNIWYDVYSREDIWTWLFSHDLSDRFPNLKETEPITESPTEAPTQEPSVPTQPVSTTQAPAQEKGCGAAMSTLCGMALSILSVGVLMRRKED